jgi:hypothetical protein
MMATNLVIGAPVLLLLFVHGAGQLWLIYLVTALYGAAAIVFRSAHSALPRTMLPDELLGEGNAACGQSRLRLPRQQCMHAAAWRCGPRSKMPPRATKGDDDQHANNPLESIS